MKAVLRSLLVLAVVAASAVLLQRDISNPLVEARLEPSRQIQSANREKPPVEFIAAGIKTQTSRSTKARKPAKNIVALMFLDLARRS